MKGYEKVSRRGFLQCLVEGVCRCRAAEPHQAHDFLRSGFFCQGLLDFGRSFGRQFIVDIGDKSLPVDRYRISSHRSVPN
jgi:hypothetical protein